MKQTRVLYRLAGFCMCFAACSPADDVAVLPLEVSAEIASASTRAVDKTNYDKSIFDLNDEITVSLKNTPSTTAKYKRGVSNWLPSTAGTEGLTTTGGQTYIATYPVTFSSIGEDQTTYTGFWSSNQLKSEATAIANKVSFSFTPVAAKITIVVTYDVTKTPEETKIDGTGIRTNGTASETIKLLRTSESGAQKRHSFVGIISPGTARTYTISVKNSGETVQSYKQSEIKLLAGHNYQYTFSSSNELILTSVTVNPFTEQTEEDGGSAT